MRVLLSFLSILLAHNYVRAGSPVKRNHDTYNYYVLEHDRRDPIAASLADVARTLGVEVVDQVGELSDHWLVRAAKPVDSLSVRREETDRVIRALEDIRSLAAHHSGSHFSSRSENVRRAREVSSAVKYFARQELRQRAKRAPPPIRPDDTPADIVATRLGIQDPMFPQQWHLVNNDYPEHMMNATPVWEMGFTGKGVISALVDDGLDYESEDLAENFDVYGSYDFNDHEDLPTPKLYDDHHGTRCAGQIAAGKNKACGLGIAYESKVAGLRILSGPISDVDEAAALNYAYQNTSIYSCSWGPPDNGRSMEGPTYLIKKAVVNGINNGRGGKGSIFVFASGNGAAHSDQCNFDGYTNSIYSVTVSAVDHKGLHPYYSEPCAANMIVAYSSGSGENIVTTDKGKNKCATSHGGTSAAAPNAVGVFALALQVRPDLTWRDVQYLCIETARMINPTDPDWEKMATGRLYSYKYGFGVLDASLFVKAAQDWKLVKPQTWFESPTIQISDGKMNMLEEMSGGEPIPAGGITSKLTVTRDMLVNHNFEALEHINIKVWISHTRRGDVEVELLSPKGVKSVLAAKRSGDTASTGFPGWIFMSVKHWGEDPVGEWTIRVTDQESENENGSFLGWNMMFWGSTVDPSKAKLYEVPTFETLLPPVQHHEELPSTTALPPVTSTKTHTKPTAHLPGNHSDVEGENSKPAFPGQEAEESAPTSTPTPDEGWFSDMSNLVYSQKWFFAALGIVLLFGISAGIFFWRRRIARLRRANYSSLPAGDDVAMSALRDGQPAPGGPRTKELYDAFGEVSDDEDADEETRLQGGPHGLSPGGLGFHSGFLDDDEPPSTGGRTPKYRDEPMGEHPSSAEIERRSPEGGAPGTPTSTSGDGSWEHASQTR